MPYTWVDLLLHCSVYNSADIANAQAATPTQARATTAASAQGG